MSKELTWIRKASEQSNVIESINTDVPLEPININSLSKRELINLGKDLGLHVSDKMRVDDIRSSISDYLNAEVTPDFEELSIDELKALAIESGLESVPEDRELLLELLRATL